MPHCPWDFRTPAQQPPWLQEKLLRESWQGWTKHKNDGCVRCSVQNMNYLTYCLVSNWNKLKDLLAPSLIAPSGTDGGDFQSNAKPNLQHQPEMRWNYAMELCNDRKNTWLHVWTHPIDGSKVHPKLIRMLCVWLNNSKVWGQDEWIKLAIAWPQATLNP